MIMLTENHIDFIEAMFDKMNLYNWLRWLYIAKQLIGWYIHFLSNGLHAFSYVIKEITLYGNISW